MGTKFTSIPLPEKALYFFTWTSAVIYSVYRFAVPLYDYFYDFEDQYNDFTNGFLSSKRDRADFEWESIGHILKRFYPCAIFYLIISEVIRWLQVSYKIVSQTLQVLLILCYVQMQMGSIFNLLLVFQPLLFYCILTISQKLPVVWTCSAISIGLIAYFKHITGNEAYQKLFDVNEYDLFLLTLSLSWMNLKCTSYYLCSHNNSFLDFISYCFYPPTFFTGPFISYEDYHHKYVTSKCLPLDVRLKRLFRNISHCAFWLGFGNICLHFIYVNAAAYQTEAVRSLNSWSLYGYGYAMGQFFHIKYVVLYGLSTSLASFENIEVPRLPRCIGRIHLYSDMWKYFDPGLYKFLVRHVYLPILKSIQIKVIASLACFIFVYLWHGLEGYILVWSTLNYLGVVMENTAAYLYDHFLNNSIVIKIFSSNAITRLKCLSAAPLLALSAVSNFYFFGGMEIGNIFLSRLFNDNLWNYIILILVLYSCCQVSTDLKTLEARKCN